MNKSYLYFIVIDLDNNIFVYYHIRMIEYIDECIDDEYFFIFTLNNNEKCKINKFNNKQHIYMYKYL